MTPAVKLLEKTRFRFKSIPTSTIRLETNFGDEVVKKLGFESGSGLQNAAGGSER